MRYDHKFPGWTAGELKGTLAQVMNERDEFAAKVERLKTAEVSMQERALNQFEENSRLKTEITRLEAEMHREPLSEWASAVAREAEVERLGKIKAEYAQFAKNTEAVNLATEARETKLEAEVERLEKINSEVALLVSDQAFALGQAQAEGRTAGLTEATEVVTACLAHQTARMKLGGEDGQSASYCVGVIAAIMGALADKERKTLLSEGASAVAPEADVLLWKARAVEMRRLGDEMCMTLESEAGTGEVCGLCHVYSSHHKGNCALHDVAAWRSATKGWDP